MIPLDIEIKTDTVRLTLYVAKNILRARYSRKKKKTSLLTIVANLRIQMEMCMQRIHESAGAVLLCCGVVRVLHILTCNREG